MAKTYLEKLHTAQALVIGVAEKKGKMTVLARLSNPHGIMKQEDFQTMADTLVGNLYDRLGTRKLIFMQPCEPSVEIADVQIER